MAAHLAASDVTSAQHVWLNRRVYIRRECGRRTTTRVAAAGVRARAARIQDISLGGLAVVSRQRLRVGARLLIQVKNEALDVRYDLSARVVHATPKRRDEWVLGCVFARPLSQPELQTLL